MVEGRDEQMVLYCDAGSYILIKRATREFKNGERDALGAAGAPYRGRRWAPPSAGARLRSDFQDTAKAATCFSCDLVQSRLRTLAEGFARQLLLTMHVSMPLVCELNFTYDHVPASCYYLYKDRRSAGSRDLFPSPHRPGIHQACRHRRRNPGHLAGRTHHGRISQSISPPINRSAMRSPSSAIWRPHRKRTSSNCRISAHLSRN